MAEEGHGWLYTEERVAEIREGGEDGDRGQMEVKEVNPVMSQDLQKKGGTRPAIGAWVKTGCSAPPRRRASSDPTLTSIEPCSLKASATKPRTLARASSLRICETPSATGMYASVSSTTFLPRLAEDLVGDMATGRSFEGRT